MASDLFDFLYSGSTPATKRQENDGYVNLTTRADMDCQVLCDGDFLFLMNANQITKERVPVGSHILQFVSIESPDQCIEKVVDFPIAGRNYLVLADEFKKILSQRVKEKEALEVEAKAKADAEEAARKAKAEAEARAKAEAEERARAAEAAKVRAKAEAEARERAEAEARAKERARIEAEAKARAELEARTPKLGTLRIASRKIANLEARYEGFVLNGKPEGHGIAYYDNGDRYDGDWKNGLKCGQGSYFWSDGSSYDGQWADDSMDGQGILLFTDGDRFEGEFKDGRRNGKGVYIFENGNRHVSTWKNGEPGKRYRFYFKSGGYIDGNSWFGNFPYGGFDGVVTNQDNQKFYYENGNLTCNCQNDGILFRSSRDVLVVIKYEENSSSYPEIIGVYYNIEKGRECAEKEHCWFDEKILCLKLNLNGMKIKSKHCYIAIQAFDSSTRVPVVVSFDGEEDKVRSELSRKSGLDFSYQDYDYDYDHNYHWKIFCEEIKGFPDF